MKPSVPQSCTLACSDVQHDQPRIIWFRFALKSVSLKQANHWHHWIMHLVQVCPRRMDFIPQRSCLNILCFIDYKYQVLLAEQVLFYPQEFHNVVANQTVYSSCLLCKVFPTADTLNNLFVFISFALWSHISWKLHIHTMDLWELITA